MNIHEKIYVWNPLEGLEGKFYIKSVCNDMDGFRIVLVKCDDEKKIVGINFYGAVEAYRESSDVLSMHLLQGTVEPAIENEKSHVWSFFKLESSEYLQWASYQSNRLSESLGLVHYGIWTEDWTLEILSWSEPRVEFVKTEELKN